ncbi:MAG: HAD-IB family hydrolase [Chloroflexota bacterium]|nr:HAD-IB family hydrolase [Chloroflexota bacterium]
MDKSTHAVVFCDLDGTLYTGHIWQALKRHHQVHRIKLPTLYFFLSTHMTLGLLYWLGLVSGERFFREWAIHMAWLLSGLTSQRAQQVFDWVTEEDVLPKLRTNVLARLREHQAQGERVVLLSGTFQPLLETIASRLELDGALGTELTLHNGRYNGHIVQPPCLIEGKALRLDTYLSAHPEVDPTACTAYADTLFDLLALERVGHPVAVYPDSRLAAVAVERGWPIVGNPREPD